MSAPSENLSRRLRECGAEELLELVREHASNLDAPTARQIFRNPHTTTQVLEILLTQKHLLPYYEVRRELATHRKAPVAAALQMVPGLFWRDLLSLSVDVRVTPVIRRSAEKHLIARLPSLAVGEKVSLARRSTPMILNHLRHDPSSHVIAALLENPRLTEGSLLPMLASEKTLPRVLGLVGASQRWGTRYEVRLVLCSNPNTPLQTSIPMLPALKKPHIQRVARDVRLPPVLRRKAKTLLGEDL